MNHIHLLNSDILGYTQDILRQMQHDNWQPDYIVGLTRGGLVPAVYISQYLNCPLETLKVSLSTEKTESNLWMAEDAFGYIEEQDRGEAVVYSDPTARKKILIVDDINDSGATLNWIVNDWQNSCLPFAADIWNEVWGNNVRFATLVDNTSSKFNHKINYTAREINKAEDPSWIIFPWEEWWKA